MADTATAEIISFRRDMTLRLSCRADDFLLWFGYGDFFSGPDAVQSFDIWEMRDGYRVTMPAWFRLHPTEVRDRFVYKMVGKFEQGNYPSEPMDGSKPVAAQGR